MLGMHHRPRCTTLSSCAEAYNCVRGTSLRVSFRIFEKTSLPRLRHMHAAAIVNFDFIICVPCNLETSRSLQTAPCSLQTARPPFQ